MAGTFESMKTKPHTLSVRTPDDLLAAVPCVLGFHPTESLVMLTFSRRGPAFHARVDLPLDPADDVDVRYTLIRAALANHVDRVALVAYSDDPVRASEVLQELLHPFLDHGLEVIDLLRVTDSAWFRVEPGSDPLLAEGRCFDTTSHAFTAQSVLDGRVTHASREELAATLAADLQARAAATAALDSLPVDLDCLQHPAEAAWLAHTVHRLTRSGELPDPDIVARLARAVLEEPLRDVAWSLATREYADEHASLWRSVLRSAPDGYAAAPAALLAFAAWLSGQGALAWCAVDRCLAEDPEDGLAARVAMLLEEALPPHLWESVRDVPDLSPEA